MHRSSWSARAGVRSLSFDTSLEYPKDHPISAERARELIAGDLGNVFRDMLRATCAPLYWHSHNRESGRRIEHNGTVTFGKIGERTFGITAAHVLEAFRQAQETGECILQIGNALYPLDVIASDPAEDVALINISSDVLRAVGKPITHMEILDWTQVPQEGRGIMLAGFPGNDLATIAPHVPVWGLFTAVGVSRRVNATQITWVPNHEDNIPARGIPNLIPHRDLGGISGGPLIAWFERCALSYPVLAGIIVEADSILENVIARRLDTVAAKRLFAQLKAPLAR